MNNPLIKVYVGDFKLVFLLDNEQNAQLNGRKMPFNAKTVLLEIKNLAEDIIFLCKNVEDSFTEFCNEFKIIEAAGGLIKNNEQQYLFIFRHGKWDLPKGKLEKHERPEAAAVRECQEECGIQHIELKSFLVNTYHIYNFKQKLALKKTHWYLMDCQQKQFIPQLEESITAVAWQNVTDFKELMKNSYRNIEDVLITAGLLAK